MSISGTLSELEKQGIPKQNCEYATEGVYTAFICEECSGTRIVDPFK